MPSFTLSVALLFLAAACAHTATSPPSPGLEHEQVREAVAGVMHDIDAKRWPSLRARFAGEVATDYTSLFGGTPQAQAGDALIASWQKVLANVATHHQLGPITVRVAGERAFAECHVRGFHHAARAASGPGWEVLGHYLFELQRAPDGGFRIDKLTLITMAQTGNLKLLAEANGQ